MGGDLNDDNSFGKSTDGDEGNSGEIEDDVNSLNELVLPKMTVPKLNEKHHKSRVHRHPSRRKS